MAVGLSRQDLRAVKNLRDGIDAALRAPAAQKTARYTDPRGEMRRTFEMPVRRPKSTFHHARAPAQREEHLPNLEVLNLFRCLLTV